jgi:periplasmic divalent cation tolerance protein
LISTTKRSERKPDGALLVMTTASGEDAASALARTLVEEGLAACVSRVPVVSVYRWQGRICEDGEVMLVVKTSRSRLADVESRIGELHDYECPEILAVAPEHVEARYLEWLLSSCGGAS